MDFSYNVTLGEKDIKIAIARYIGVMMGIEPPSPEDVDIIYASECMARVYNKTIKTSNLR